MKTEEYIKLLETLKFEGSINAASKTLGISYKACWKLLQELKESYPSYDIVDSWLGGSKGGGTSITKQGLQLLNILKNVNEH